VLFVSFAEDEIFLSKVAVLVVDDDHSFRLEGNAAFVTDVGPRQGVITSDHDHTDLRLLELLNGRLGLWLQLVLEDLEAVEGESSLGLVTSDRLVAAARHPLAPDCEYSEPVRGVIGQNLEVVLRDGGLLHDAHHDFWGALDVALEGVLRDLGDHAHALEVRVELEPPVDLSGLVPCGFEGKDDLGVAVPLVQGELAELEELDLHGVANKLLCLFNLDDGVVRSHVIEDVD
jgi:hypothetical protein